MHRFKTFLILVPSVLSLYGQGVFSSSLQHFQQSYSNEKVYLHLDKPYYRAGDQIWFKAYITDASSHLPTTKSRTLYVELLQQDKIMLDSVKLKIEEGVTRGSVSLGKALESGNYRIRAYTNWMRNTDADFFFKKNLTIINPEIKKDSANVEEVYIPRLLVSFMPEGGDLIKGIPSKVAIKVTDEYGNGVTSSGLILDQEGRKISKFQCNKFGHGVFLLIPNQSNSYFAEIGSEKFALPEITLQGASMKVDHKYQSGSITVGVFSNGIDLTGGTLVAHQRGKYLFSKECTHPTSFTIKLKESQLGSGLVHLTFFNKNNVPLTERLIFANIPSADSPISITSDKEVYRKRSAITLGLESFKDSIHSASITINPKEEVSYSAIDENIVNYLLLSSDLKGKIESPGHYFTGSAEAFNDLNLLILTQGWSRFNWQEVLKIEKEIPAFQAEKGIYIKGQVIDYYNEKPREAEISLTIPTLGIFETTGQTDVNGNFLISVEEFTDTTQVFIKAFGYKGKRKRYYENVRIKLEYIPKPEIQSIHQPQLSVPKAFSEKAELLDQIEKAYFLNQEATLLDEVVVSAERYDDEDEFYNRTNYYDVPSNRMILDSLGFEIGGLSILDLFRRLPGVLVSGNAVTVQGSVSLSGSSEPLFILDNLPADFEEIEFLPALDIEFIDVLKGGDATAFGSNGGNGVILIYTREGTFSGVERPPKGILAFKYQGYQRMKKFYSPDYSVPDEKHVVPDYRSTLFWEPDIVFNEGKSQVSFYSSDQSGDYSVRIEGILKSGTPFLTEGNIIVK